MLGDPVARGLVHLGISTVSILVMGLVTPGIKVRGLRDAFIFALTVAFINALFWHFLRGEPFTTVLLAGPGSVLGNALLFWLTAKVVDGVKVSGCFTALLAAIGVTVINAVIRFVIGL
jgi:uncharacterized membrane protein YvlD (DUF360 family)